MLVFIMVHGIRDGYRRDSGSPRPGRDERSRIYRYAHARKFV